MKISSLDFNNIKQFSPAQKIAYRGSYVNLDSVDINSAEWKRFCKVRKHPNLYKIDHALLRKISSDEELSKKLEEISKSKEHSQNLLAMSQDERLIPLINNSKMPLKSLLKYSTFNKEACQKFSSLLDNPEVYNYLLKLEKDSDVFDYEINNLISLNNFQFDIMMRLLNKTKKIDTETLDYLYQDTLAENFFMQYDADIFSMAHDKKIDESLNLAMEGFFEECKKRQIPTYNIERIKHSLKPMEFLQDSTIKKYLIARFLMMTHDKKTDMVVHLDEIRMLTDAINTFRCHYSTYKKNFAQDSYITDFIKYLKEQNIDYTAPCREIIAEMKEKQISPEVLKRDFAKEARLYLLKEYLKNYYDSPIADYLYAIYLKDCYYKREITLDDLKKLDEIKNKYNTRIILGYKTDETEDVLDFIDKEFSSWDKASDGKAQYPHIIDFLSIKRAYYDKSSAYGMGSAAAFAQSKYKDSISYKTMASYYVKNTTRHEMTHLNDKNALNNLHYILFPIFKRGVEKELKKGGVPKWHISYAFSHPREMLAVASEGNFSQYSAFFRKLLNKYGMPEWEFQLEENKD